MATADRDEDEKDEAADDENDAAQAKDAKKDPKKKEKPASKAAAKAEPAHADEDEEEEEDEGDADDEEEEEEAKPPPKPVAKSAGKRPAGKGPVARGPGAARGKAGGSGQSGSLGKSVMLFFVIVIGLGAGFAILGRETPVEIAKPKWKTGETADVEITLVKSDRQDLACAATDEVAGKHCAFEAMSKPWSKGNLTDDKLILKPYTTTDRVQFTAAGLWADPAMAPDKLPATRFTVKCKYKVEGKLPTVGVRWEQTGQWFPNTDWYAGSVSDCKVSG